MVWLPAKQGACFCGIRDEMRPRFARFAAEPSSAGSGDPA